MLKVYLDKDSSVFLALVTDSEIISFCILKVLLGLT